MNKISKKEYKEAKNIVEEFDKELNKNFVSNYTCVCCKTNVIKPINNMNPLDQDNGMWDGGVVVFLNAGYGSIYDTDAFYVGICDGCIEVLEKEKLIKNYKELCKNYSAEKDGDYNFNKITL